MHIRLILSDSGDIVGAAAYDAGGECIERWLNPAVEGAEQAEKVILSDADYRVRVRAWAQRRGMVKEAEQRQKRLF